MHSILVRSWLLLCVTHQMISVSDSTLAEAVDEVFDGEVGAHEKRHAASPVRILSYICDPAPGEDIVGFNVSMDGSGRKISVKLSTPAGYTYSNGTTLYGTTARDILESMLTIKRNAPSINLAERDLSSHTLSLALELEGLNDKLLDGGIVCRPPVAAAPSHVPIYDEDRSSIAKSYMKFHQFHVL